MLEETDLTRDDYKRKFEALREENSKLKEQLGEILEAARWFFEMPDNLGNGMARLKKLDEVYMKNRGF